jgi:sporulation protein YlmC with PRC-barrel domain
MSEIRRFLSTVKSFDFEGSPSPWKRSPFPLAIIKFFWIAEIYTRKYPLIIRKIYKGGLAFLKITRCNMKERKLKEIMGMKVFTDNGDYFGEVEEVNLAENKVDGWRIKLARDSNLSGFLGNAKGLIIPHQFVKAMGDVMVVSRSAVPTKEEEPEEGPAAA